MLLLFRKLRPFGKKEKTRGWFPCMLLFHSYKITTEKCDNIRHLSERFVQQELTTALGEIFLKLRRKWLERELCLFWLFSCQRKETDGNPFSECILAMKMLPLFFNMIISAALSFNLLLSLLNLLLCFKKFTFYWCFATLYNTCQYKTISFS